jgi:type I restriction enzyme, R subunit
LALQPTLKKPFQFTQKAEGKGKPAFDQDEAAEVMMGKYEVVAQMFSEQPADKSQPKGSITKVSLGLHQKKNCISRFRLPIIFWA